MMGRRTKDPLGVSDNPIVVTDPAREAELAVEQTRKFRYLIESYRFETRARLDGKSFNASLKQLKAGIRSSDNWPEKPTRLHPQLEVAINLEARELAGLPDDAILETEHGPFVRQACHNVAARANPIRGRPGNKILKRYVAAAMALIQEATGKPVVPKRDDRSVYDPQIPGHAGQVIRQLTDMLQPGISDTTLWGWADEARKKFAGKRMRFVDYFPGYGAIAGPGGSLQLRSPHKLERSGICFPIYLPARPTA